MSTLFLKIVFFSLKSGYPDYNSSNTVMHLSPLPTSSLKNLEIYQRWWNFDRPFFLALPLLSKNLPIQMPLSLIDSKIFINPSPPNSTQIDQSHFTISTVVYYPSPSIHLHTSIVTRTVKPYSIPPQLSFFNPTREEEEAWALERVLCPTYWGL